MKVGALRKSVAAFTTSTGFTMVEVKDVRGGARLAATNPWTHKTATYTVKASGRKVTVTG